jgi:hypothetical protein
MKIFEIYSGLFESKASEAQGLNILRKAGIENPEEVMQGFVSGDNSKNQKNIPVMAYIYANGYTDMNNILSVMDEYNELEIKNRVKPIQMGKNGLAIGARSFEDFLRFSEFIHGETNKYSKKPEGGSNVADDFTSEKKALWSGNGIDIYDGTDVGRCIEYTQGSLTGKGYGFCIGQPGNTMYKSYRDTKGSSFYFIVDRNHFKENPDGGVNLDDPLHIVVFDNTKYGVELTDANNTTGNISKYGDNADAYVDYLESKGVPVDKLIHKPKTSQEDEEEALLGRQNNDLDWFIRLPMEYKSAYIGRGHRLTDAQFDYLIGHE